MSCTSARLAATATATSSGWTSNVAALAAAIIVIVPLEEPALGAFAIWARPANS